MMQQGFTNSLRKYDLHTHTSFSPCGSMKPDELIAQALSVSLHGIAITDHNTMDGVMQALEMQEDGTAPQTLEIIPGEEITTDRGEIIGLFLKEAIEPGAFEDTIAAIKKQNGLVIVPHPFDPIRKAVKPLDQEAILFDAIEVLNGRAAYAAINKQARTYAQRNNRAMVCGSDAHYPFEVGMVTFTIPEEIDSKIAISSGNGVIDAKKREFAYYYTKKICGKIKRIVRKKSHI